MSVKTLEGHKKQVLEVMDNWFIIPVRNCTGFELEVGSGGSMPLAKFYNHFSDKPIMGTLNPKKYIRDDESVNGIAIAIINDLKGVIDFYDNELTYFKLICKSDEVIMIETKQAVDFK